MKLPLILINFKCYKSGTGDDALKLAKICEFVSKEKGVEIAIAPQFVDIFRISHEVDIPVFSQHLDPIEPGPFSAHVSAKALKEAGAIGTLINHSEKRLEIKKIRECIRIAKKYKLITICCSKSVKESKEIAKFNPDFIAYEPPELIGKGIAVSKAKPEIITKTIKEVRKINPKVKILCGAGIAKGKDVKKAIELGTVGILAASSVVKARDPEKVLEDFAESLKI